PPQKCGHLGLNRALQQQLRAQPGDPLNRARQIRAAGEHLIDLRAQPLGGRYSLRHGRRLLPQTCWSSREPTSDSFYTAAGTRPSAASASASPFRSSPALVTRVLSIGVIASKSSGNFGSPASFRLFVSSYTARAAGLIPATASSSSARIDALRCILRSCLCCR